MIAPDRRAAAALLERVASQHVDEPLSADETRWVRRACRTYYGGIVATLGEAFGLDHPARARRAARRVARDRLLGIAAALVAPGASPWQQAGVLERRIADRARPGGPDDDVAALLMAAERLHPLPASREGIFQALPRRDARSAEHLVEVDDRGE